MTVACEYAGSTTAVRGRPVKATAHAVELLAARPHGSKMGCKRARGLGWATRDRLACAHISPGRESGKMRAVIRRSLGSAPEKKIEPPGDPTACRRSHPTFPPGFGLSVTAGGEEPQCYAAIGFGTGDAAELVRLSELQVPPLIDQSCDCQPGGVHCPGRQR